MVMSEQDFYLLNGGGYRGSKYANFAGAGIDTQGNVSSAINENAASQAGTATEGGQPSAGGTGNAIGQPSVDSRNAAIRASAGLTKPPTVPTFGGAVKDLAIGAALPYAGSTIGKSLGAALGSGSSFGSAAGEGLGSLANKVSGGLIGSPASSTAGLSGSSVYGPPKPGASSGSSIGGAVGSGLGTFAAGLLTGEKPVEAAKAGVGSAVGTYVGTAVAGPIGGFIGGTIGSLFCFAPDTEILMADGSTKQIADLNLGDDVLYGGIVTGKGECYTEELYSYKGTQVTGTHAVLEDGAWIRVRDSASAEKLDIDLATVAPITTVKHILVTKQFVSADLHEISPDEGARFNYDDRLEMLNSNKERNEELVNLAAKYCAV